NPKSDYIYSLVQGLLAAGVPIHGVGLQMHTGGFFGPPSTTVEANIQRFVDLGLAVNVTELDVQAANLGPDNPTRLAAQRVIYHDLVAACVAVPGCDTITTWGFTDRYTWIDDAFGPGQQPLPFDTNYVPKPAYFGITAALAVHRPGPRPDDRPGNFPMARLVGNSPTLAAGVPPMARGLARSHHTRERCHNRSGPERESSWRGPSTSSIPCRNGDCRRASR